MTSINGLPGFWEWGYMGQSTSQWYTDYRTQEQRLKGQAEIMQRSVEWNELMGNKLNEVIEVVNTRIDPESGAVIGPEGPEGPMGPEGPAGVAGPVGPKGDKGDTGLTGATGAAGAPGAPGATGLTGPKGDKGDKGDTGLTGPAGPQGIQGIQGVKGDTGATGPAGPQGPAGTGSGEGTVGPQGIQGETGPAGPQGPQGVEGPQGPAGPQGIQGEPGLDGAVGPQGPEGPAGSSTADPEVLSRLDTVESNLTTTESKADSAYSLAETANSSVATLQGNQFVQSNSLAMDLAPEVPTIKLTTQTNSLDPSIPTVTEASVPFFSSDGSVSVSRTYEPTLGVDGVDFTIPANDIAITGLGTLTTDGKYLPLDSLSRTAAQWTTATYATVAELPETGDEGVIYNVGTMSYVFRATNFGMSQADVSYDTWGTVTGGRYFPIITNSPDTGNQSIAYWIDGKVKNGRFRINYRAFLDFIDITAENKTQEYRFPASAVSDAGTVYLDSTDYSVTPQVLVGPMSAKIDSSYLKSHILIDDVTSELVLKVTATSDLLNDLSLTPGGFLLPIVVDFKF